MLNSLLKISNTAKGLTVSPEIGHNILATLGAKPGSLNFQQLMTSSLGGLPNSHKKGTASLSFLNSMTKPFADFNPLGSEHSELRSIKQIVQSFKEQAGKSQKPLAFQYNSKFLGNISFEIEPAKNRLTVGLDEEQLKTSDLLIAELTPLFDRIEFGSVFGFQQPAFSSQFSAINRQQSTVSNQLSARNLQPLASGSQLSATQAFGVIKELIEVSGKLPVKTNNPGQKVELNVESIGNISVDLKRVSGKLLVQIGLPTKQTLDNFKTGFQKSTGFAAASLKFIIAKPEQDTHTIIQASDKLLEIKKGLVGDRQTPKVSMKQAFEIIQRRIVEGRDFHSIIKNPRQLLNLNIDALGNVSVEIENGGGKIKLKAEVNSQTAGKVLRKRLGALVARASDLKVFVRSPGENDGKKVSSGVPLVNSGTKIKPAQAVEIVVKNVKSVTSTSLKTSSVAPLTNSGAKIKPAQAVEIVEKNIKPVTSTSLKTSSVAPLTNSGAKIKPAQTAEIVEKNIKSVTSTSLKTSSVGPLANSGAKIKPAQAILTVEKEVEAIASTSLKTLRVAPLARLGAEIKPAQAIMTVEKVVEAIASTSLEISSKLKFGLQTDSLGDVEADVETSDGKTTLSLNVDSNSVKDLLSKRLGRKIQNLDIRVKEVSTSPKIKGFKGQFKLNSKLSTSQAIQSIREVIKSVSQISLKSGQNQIQVQMEVENFGKIAVEISKDVKDGNVLLRTDSSPARDWLTQQLAKSGLQVKEIKTGKNKGALNLKFDSPLDENLETAAKEKTILQPKESTQPTALKKFTELMDVLLGPATPVKSRSTKLSKIRVKPSDKLDRGKISIRGKDSGQDRGVLAPQENKSKLRNDLSSTREFLGEILENIEGDSAEYIESNLSESERAIQPVSTSSNVNFDVLGGKVMSSGTVERSHLPQMIQKILELANSQSSTAGQKLEIQLDVEELGSLLVDAVKHKDKINLHINVDNSEVRRMLESQLRPLLDQMLKEGIDVGKLEVSVKNENSDNANQWQTAENEREFREQNSNSETPVSAYAKEVIPMSRQRDFGYNSIEVLA